MKAKALEIWGAIKEWFKETIDNIAQFFKDLWQGIKDTFLPIGEWFKKKFETARDNVKAAFSGGELLRLIEVGASCFNHYCVGYDIRNHTSYTMSTGV